MNKHCIEYIYEKKIYYKSNKCTAVLSCRWGHSITDSIYTYKDMIVI